MLATVRNRRGIVSAVEPFDGGVGGRLHLVTVEYTDAGVPADDQLIWEREPGGRLLEPTALPDPSRDAPMPAEDFDALVRATRWTAISPFLDPDGPAGPLTRHARNILGEDGFARLQAELQGEYASRPEETASLAADAPGLSGASRPSGQHRLFPGTPAPFGETMEAAPKGKKR